MNVGNCPRCGKLYAKNATGMCTDCYREEELNEIKVAEYVRDHPKSSIDAIHEATGVKEKTIFRMIKNGRFVSDAEVNYPCQVCGAPIHQGRLCNNCNSNFIKQVKDSEAKRAAERAPVNKDRDKDKRGSGMYTKDM